MKKMYCNLTILHKGKSPRLYIEELLLHKHQDLCLAVQEKTI